jgi:hypothetical protein
MENSLLEPKVFINSTTPKLVANNFIESKLPSKKSYINSTKSCIYITPIPIDYN